MILGDKRIIEMQRTHNIFSPFNEELVQGASYDMSLGRQYCKNAEIKEPTSDSHSLSIAPGEFVLVTSREKIDMPLNLVGHNGLMSKWTKVGLISLFSPQIDPGFKGVLIVPIINVGQNIITIAFGEPIFTVELLECSECSEGWSTKHKKEQLGIVSPWGPIAIGPNLGQISAIEKQLEDNSSLIRELERDLIELKAKATAYDKSKAKFISKRAYFLSVIGVIVSISGLLFTAIRFGFIKI
jgi:dCTP deaminase